MTVLQLPACEFCGRVARPTAPGREACCDDCARQINGPSGPEWCGIVFDDDPPDWMGPAEAPCVPIRGRGDDRSGGDQ